MKSTSVLSKLIKTNFKAVEFYASLNIWTKEALTFIKNINQQHTTMENMKIEMLCQQTYGEYGGDPYEARVYFERDAQNYMEAQDAIIECCEKLNEYDPIHGFTFDIYINKEYRGYYEKDLKTIHLDKAFKIMLIIDMALANLITEDELSDLLKIT